MRSSIPSAGTGTRLLLLLTLALGACSESQSDRPDGSTSNDGSTSGDGSTSNDGSTSGDGSLPDESVVAYTGGTYTQSFDGLPSSSDSTNDVFSELLGKGPFGFSTLTGLVATSDMNGWYFANPLGSSENTELRAHDGGRASSDGRGIVSFGADGASERALGALPTGNQVGRFGVLVRNDTSALLDRVSIELRAEQWRRGNVAAPNTLAFEYGVGTTIDAGGLTADAALSPVSPNTASGVGETEIALDGNAAANRATLSATLEGLAWQPGQVLVLRWTMNDQSGQDDGLAIDDFTLSAESTGATPDAGVGDAGMEPDGGAEPDGGTTEPTEVAFGFEDVEGEYASFEVFGGWTPFVSDLTIVATAASLGIPAYEGVNVLYFSAPTTGFGDNKIDVCVEIDPTKALTFGYAVYADVESVDDNLRVRVNPRFYADLATCQTDVAANNNNGNLGNGGDWDARLAAAGVSPSTWTVIDTATHETTGPMGYAVASYPETTTVMRFSLRFRDDGLAGDPTRRVYLDSFVIVQPD